MKRWIAILLALVMLFSLASCTRHPQQPEIEPPVEESAAPETPAPTEIPAPTEAPIPTETPSPTEAPVPTEPPAAAASASPLMWKVTDADGHTLYLFGTIHVGDERNDAVLDRVSSVLDSCDALAVEFDTVAYEQDTKRAMNDLAQYVLTDGSLITDYMPDELYQRACELLEKAGLYPAIFNRYNLAMWAQLLDSAMLMQYSDLDSEKGMDSLLIRRAYEKEIPVLDVESSEFQMNLLNSFDNELYLLQIEAALDGADSYGEDLHSMYELWLSGDRDAFWALLAGDEEDDVSGDYTEEQIALIEDYNRKLLDERNLGMRDRALEYLASGDTVFFAVGAAHMANDVGLVQLLSEAGCTVEPCEY